MGSKMLSIDCAVPVTTRAPLTTATAARARDNATVRDCRQGNAPMMPVEVGVHAGGEAAVA